MIVFTTAIMAQSNNQLHRTENAGAGIYNPQAKDISFSVSDIQFWCGTGSNQAIVITAWDDYSTPTALAWGVRWNGSAVALDLLDSIAAYDSRYTFAMSGSLLTNVQFTENGTTMYSPTNYWCYYLNGDWAMNTYDNQTVASGDVIEMSGTCDFDMTTAIAAVNPNAVDTTERIPDATIDHQNILYWVGQGSNEAVIAVNWADPDTCLAWGVRFSDDTITVKAAMDSIACADYRFSYIPGSWGINDIIYNDYQGTRWALTMPEGVYNYWWSNYNGTAAGYAYDEQPLINGDIFKWGDPTCGVVIDTAYGYPSEIAWTTSVTPISVLVSGPFCGAASTEGSQAIEYNDSRIKGWATTCTIVRGHIDIADTNSAYASYGAESDAVGACDNNNLAVVSLGDGGYATLTFEHAISNGEGYDFAVFENSFNDNFLELAFVEVSTDGEHFVRFPSTSLTSSCANIGGNGGIDPTYIDGLAGKYRTGFGTPFDLEQLRDSANINIDSIVYVRIVDVVGTSNPDYATYDQFGNIVIDPYPTNSYSSGFDLDGICVLNWNYTEPEVPESIDDVLTQDIQIYPNPANSQVYCHANTDGMHQMFIYDMSGRQIISSTFYGTETTLSVDDLAGGVYMIRIDGVNHRLVVKH